MVSKTVRFPNLQAELSRAGINQKELAEVLGIDQSIVSRWFSGKQDMSASTCFAIKERLFPTLSLDYLFTNEPIKPET